MQHHEGFVQLDQISPTSRSPKHALTVNSMGKCQKMASNQENKKSISSATETWRQTKKKSQSIIRFTQLKQEPYILSGSTKETGNPRLIAEIFRSRKREREGIELPRFGAFCFPLTPSDSPSDAERPASG